jgi:hypothetical protein
MIEAGSAYESKTAGVYTVTANTVDELQGLSPDETVNELVADGLTVMALVVSPELHV